MQVASARMGKYVLEEDWNGKRTNVDFSFWNLLRDEKAAFGEELWALNQPLLGTSWCSRSLWRPLNFGHLGQTEAGVQSSIEKGFVATCLFFLDATDGFDGASSL